MPKTMLRLSLVLYILLISFTSKAEMSNLLNRDSLLVFIGTVHCDVVNYKPSTLEKISILSEYEIIYVFPPGVKDAFLDFKFESVFSELRVETMQVISSAELFQKYSPDFSTCVVDTKYNRTYRSFNSFYADLPQESDSIKINISKEVALNRPILSVVDESSLMITSRINTTIVTATLSEGSCEENKSISLYKNLPEIRAIQLESMGLNPMEVDSVLKQDSALVSKVDDAYLRKSYFQTVEASERFTIFRNGSIYSLVELFVVDSITNIGDSSKVSLSQQFCLVQLDYNELNIKGVWLVENIHDFEFHPQGWYVMDTATLVISLIDKHERRSPNTPILAEFNLESGFAKFNKFLDNKYVDGQLADNFTMGFMEMHFYPIGNGQFLFLHEVDKSIWQVGHHKQLGRVPGYPSLTIEHFMRGYLPYVASHFDRYNDKFRVVITNYNNRPATHFEDLDSDIDIVHLNENFSLEKVVTKENHFKVKSVAVYKNSFYYLIEDDDVFFLKQVGIE